jgi:hypothetical protein
LELPSVRDAQAEWEHPIERQKVTRKLKQAKKSLEAASSDSHKKKYSSELHNLRVDLNYILVRGLRAKISSMFSTILAFSALP